MRKNSSRRRRANSLFESLEGRNLLSTTPIFPVGLGAGAVISPVIPTTIFHESRGVSFTAALGSFTTIAPATNLVATINWGDGTSSKGTLKALKIMGVDVLKFEVDGTHTYSTAGDFKIQVTVVKPAITPTSPVIKVASFTDEAIVTRGNVPLTGKITGHYSLAPFVIPDIGATYIFTGSGSAGALGPAGAKGSLTLPGFIASGHATGSLTLTSASATSGITNSVTLKLTGPSQAGFGSLPSTVTYIIASGTGQFAGATGTGSIAITLGDNLSFTFTITSQ